MGLQLGVSVGVYKRFDRDALLAVRAVPAGIGSIAGDVIRRKQRVDCDAVNLIDRAENRGDTL